jgi:hypothetical protein
MSSDRNIRASATNYIFHLGLRPVLYLLRLTGIAIVITICAEPTLPIASAPILACTGLISIAVFVWHAKRFSRPTPRLVLLLLAAHAIIGFSIAESSAPAIVSGTLDNRTMREVLGDAAILRRPSDARAFSTAVVGVLREQELRSGMSIAGRKRAEQFRSDSSAKQLLEVFESTRRVARIPAIKARPLRNFYLFGRGGRL